eukprot:symbB.v1.2.001585.t1/scaffold88.1/size340390/20
MLSALFVVCFTYISNPVSGERPNYADILKKAEDLRIFHGSHSFSKANALGQTFRGGGPSFMADGRSCNEEKDIMEEVWKSLGLPHRPGSYCSWPGVHCDECHVTELRLEQPQDVHGQLSPELGRLYRLKRLDLGGAVGLTGSIEALRNATLLQELNLSHCQVEAELEILQNHPNLQHLDLENTLVKGSLDIFEKTPNLTVLRLNATSVEGNVGVFHKTPRLKELRMENASEVVGDMQVFAVAIPGLEKLTLTHSMVTGRVGNWRAENLKELRIEELPNMLLLLKSFRNAKELRKMFLKGIWVSGALKFIQTSTKLLELDLEPLEPQEIVGEIKVLEQFPQLQVLSLPKTDVKGSLRSLKNHTLRVLNLADTKVWGSIDGLHMSEMKVLNLANVGVKGHLDNLTGALNQIEVMNLQGTRVKADLRVFEEANGLKELNVGDTNVGGDIKVLKNMPELSVLNISATVAGGDIQVFQDLRELLEVHAKLTKVHGDIGIFAKAKNRKDMKVLSFGGTAVNGDIAALREATGLEKVGFTQTGVRGDIRAFEGVTHLREVWLSRTKIVGDIEAFCKCSRVEVVSLSRTSVSGSIQAFAEASELKELGLDGTTVDGDIDVFQDMKWLEALALDRTHVLGNFATFSKMKYLKSLGLEGCNITGTLYKVAASLRRLRILRLSRTLVTGELSHLASLKGLEELYAAATGFTGDIEFLMMLTDITVVDLSWTNVSGRITSKWVGKVPKLRSLDLSESRVSLLPRELEMARIEMDSDSKVKLFPVLEILQVSGCPLNSKVEDLLRILAYSKFISKISASDCNLTGTLKDLSSFRYVPGSDVTNSLLVLDISNNSIQQVETLPPNAKIMLSHNHRALNISTGVLTEANDNNQELDLRASRLTNFEETHELWKQRKLTLTPGLSFRNETGGYGCFGLDPASTNLLGFGRDLLPDHMCVCLPGFFGKGANCTPCNSSSYNGDLNQSSCKACPAQMSTDQASAKERTDEEACKCPAGRQRVGKVCGCTELQARGDGDDCIYCGERNLNCSEQGVVARDAPALDGYARLEARANRSFQCFPPAHRCNHSGQGDQNCAQGYDGILCMDCMRGHFANRGGCSPCKDPRTAMIWRGSVAVFGIVVAGALAAFMWHRVAAARVEFTGGILMEAKQNAPVLLQTCQLWAVLSALSTSQGIERGERMRSLSDWEVKLPELPIIEGLSFSLIDLQGIFDFQCMMDGATARYWKALLAPVLPLILLTLCGFMEFAKHGSGISKGLLVLSLFFVGGASSSARLASCKSHDAGGRDLGDFAFQELMPSLKCSERLPEVDGVFIATFFCYLVPIPAFLLYLFAKQHFALQTTKLLVSFSKEKTSEGKELHFARIPSDSDSQLVELKDEMLERRMVAGAVAYSAVFLGDEVQVYLKDVTVMVKGMDGELRPSALLDSGTLGSFSSDVAELKRHSDALRCRAIAELLMERCVLFERCELAPADQRDRVLAGARDMLMKYAVCQNVWMEIVLKLVTMSLVSVVRSRDGLQLSLAVTLVMATLVAFLRPYAQAQVNNLQCSCFISLAIAALSFSLRVPALSRASLVLPFLVALAQVWLPESPEGRASRIWQELEPKLMDLRSAGSAGITASTKTLSITVRRSKEGN